jgi:hypothetical protein
VRYSFHVENINSVSNVRILQRSWRSVSSLNMADIVLADNSTNFSPGHSVLIPNFMLDPPIQISFQLNELGMQGIWE